MMNNEMIGIKGERAPRVCAVSGRVLHDSPGTNITLKHPYYVRVLRLYKHQWTAKRKAELIAILPGKLSKSKQES